MLRDTAYRSFMDHLLSGDLKPGLLVSQRELCESTGSTIGAMREALKRLEAEGIITLIPQRGVMVREPDVQEINEVYEVRMLVEPHAARACASAADLDRIADLEQRTRAVLERTAETREQAAGLLREASRVDDELHQVVLGALHNRTVDRIFDQLRVPLQVSRLSVQLRFRSSRPGLREHLKIIEALRRRDGDAAAQAMTEHLEASRRREIGLD